MHSFKQSKPGVKLHLLAICIALTLFFLPQVALAVNASHWSLTTPSGGTWNAYYGQNTVQGTVYMDDLSTVSAVYAKVYNNGTGVYSDLYTATLLNPGTVTNGVYSWSFPYIFTTSGNYSVYGTVYGSTVASDVYAGGFTFSGTQPSTNNPGGSSGSTSTTDTNTTTNTTVATNNVTAATGGTITTNGVTIDIPANALEADVKVTIQTVSNTAALPMAAGDKLVSQVFEFVKSVSGNFSKPVTITLSFDTSKVDTNKYDVGIFYLNETTNSWVKLDNVSVDLATGKVSGDVTHFTKFAVLATEKSSLKDITGHWAVDNIKKLVSLGAISGYPDGTFKPDSQITRGEFAKVLVKAFKLEQKSGKVFADTTGHWAKDYIATAAASGIVNGYSETTFGPDDLITREQAAAMIVRAAKLQAATTAKEFTDSNQISTWAESAVVTATANSIISGYPDNSFKPQNNATRAEAITMIVKALK